MSQLTKNSDRDLFEILVAVAWIDGEVQAEERVFLEKIATQHDLELSEDLLSTHQTTSTSQCCELLKQYLGSNPNSQDYENLLSAVSTLIYSDNDIATEEASLLTHIQNLNPNNPDNNSHNSTFNKLIKTIQKLYQAGMKQV